jgi:hypothetical protein
MEFKQVTKEECRKFVTEYPIKLVYDVTGISEPPTGTWNDFRDGKIWPESIVARVTLYDGSDYHGGKQRVYFIKSTLCQEESE